MNSTEKKRAEQFVLEWDSTHPVEYPDVPIIQVPKKYEERIKALNQQVKDLEAEVEGEYFQFDIATYSRYDNNPAGTIAQIRGPRPTHPKLVEHQTEVHRLKSQRTNAIQDLVRRIWNDEVTFQNVLDELEQLS